MSVERRSCGKIAAGRPSGRASLTRDNRGQALIEMGIVLVLFVLLVLGVLEFGRAWMVANMITHAARDGARTAAVVGNANRVDGIINGAKKSDIENQVLAQIATVLPGSNLTATIAQPPAAQTSGIPVVQLTVTGSVNYMFNLVGPSFQVTRTVTFRDEGR